MIDQIIVTKIKNDDKDKPEIEEPWLLKGDYETLEQYQKKEIFLIDRAKGKSFDSISKKLKVSKKTLISWSNRFKQEIQNLKSIEFDRLRDQLLINKEKRVEYLGTQLTAVFSQLSKPDAFKDANPVQLLNVMIKLIESLRVEEEPVIFREKSFSSFVKDQVWVAD